MTTERFSKIEFEQALTNAQKDTTKPLWEYVGFEMGEHVYKIKIQSGELKRVAILIRSSVKADGYAASTGNDSIRMWLVNTVNNKPLGKKVDAHTKRTSGWNTRIVAKIQELYTQGYNMVNCPKCNNGVMTKRTGKYGDFYGCSNYPQCKNTMQSLPKTINVQMASEEQTIESLQHKQESVDDMNSLLQEVLEQPQEKEFVPSKYQQAIFEFVRNGTGNAVIEAVAGSGKTLSLIKALEFTPKDASVAFVAFNKSIATELKKRAPRHVHVSTLHSLGFANIRRVYPKIKVESRKVYWIVKDYLKGKEKSQFGKAVLANTSSVIRLVSLCKATLLQPASTSLEYLVSNYDVNVNGDAQHIFRMTKIAFDESLKQTYRIDFDDMIYWCAIGKVECQKFDWLFIDECQDLNKSREMLALNSIHENSRVIACGDSNQSIYGYVGADTKAMQVLADDLNATLLPLSITYRCPKSHVKLAQKLVPQIEAWENAIDSKIDDISERQLVSKVKPGDMVLCRTNAPLVSPAFELIRNGIKAIILGRDIGQGLVNLIDKVVKTTKVSKLSNLLYELDEYLYSEFSKLIAQGKENKAQSLDDKIKTINALADGCKTIDEVKQRINSVFTDNAEGVVFSSIHRAKGKEAERVFILHPELMPHPLCMKSKNPEALQQELNIKYVALTRSKSELYFVR